MSRVEIRRGAAPLRRGSGGGAGHASRSPTGRVLACTAATGLLLVLLIGCAATKPPDADPPATAMPPSALGSYLSARHAQQEHDYRQAAAQMGAALAGDPNNMELINRTFVLRLGEGDVAGAVPLAKRVVAFDATAGLASLVLLAEDIKDGHFDAAVQRAQGMQRSGAQRYAVPLLQAWADVGRGDGAAADQALQSMGDLGGLERLRSLHRALVADYLDRVDEADKAFRSFDLTTSHPTWRIIELYGNFLERRGRGADARTLYQGFAANDTDTELVADGLERIAKGVVPPRIVKGPRDGAAEAMFDLASLLNQRETEEASLVFAHLALDLKPDLALGQMLVAEIEEDMHNTARSLAVYQSIDRASPVSWSARLKAALELDELNRTDEAVALLQAMAAEKPQRADALITLGDIQRGREHFPEAVAAYDAATQRKGAAAAHDWALIYSRGVALERSGDWPRAEADLKAALVLQPDEPLILNYLGYSWIDRGENLDEALKMVERAVELKPNDGYIVDSLGWAFFRLGNYPRATSFLERATELLPEDPTVNDHLGDAYWRMGRVAEARFQWQRALQFKPEADEVKTIRTKLDQGLGRLPTATNGG
jgi:Flp pilus assembly protein TadD